MKFMDSQYNLDKFFFFFLIKNGINLLIDVDFIFIIMKASNPYLIFYKEANTVWTKLFSASILSRLRYS